MPVATHDPSPDVVDPTDLTDLAALDGVRRQIELLAERLDACRAWRTVPMGEGPRDPHRTPGVDIGVWTLHVRYRRTGAAADLTALVEEYTPLAMAIAHRLQRSGESREDLEQVALESLVASLQRFDPDRRRPFVAFATPTITGAIKRHYRDRGWALRAPRIVHDLAGPVRGARDELAAQLGRRATAAEVAEHLGIEESVVLQVDDASHARAATSLDRPLVPGGATLGDTLAHDDRDLALSSDRIALAAALESLSDRDRDLIALYYVEELPQRAIAERYGVSQMQVSRWLAGIVRRLRARMDVA